MDFDPFTPEALADPYVHYARLRAVDPVHWNEKLRSWLLLRHEDVSAALRDDARFTADRSRAARAKGRIADSRMQGLRTVASDPPDCLPPRAILNACLAPRVKALGPRLDEFIAILLDAVAEATERVVDRTELPPSVDLIERFAYALPINVIAELMGVPDADREQFRTWSRAIARGMDRFYKDPNAGAGMQQIGLYFLQLVQERRATPDAQDLVSRLCAIDHHGDRLTELEVVAMCTALVFGGHETTVNLIGNGLLALLSDPEARAQLEADPSLTATAVEELLRYDGPAHFISRAATHDFEFGGRPLRAGDSVLLGLGAANRDPAAFADPDRLHLARHQNPHLGFGLGTHFCPGAQLSRMEVRAAIPAVLRRFPRLRLADDPPVRRPTIILRGLERLPVRVD